MSTGIADILGAHPVPGTKTYESKIRRVAKRWLEICPIERATTYYFDSVSGNDSNDGLTTSTPKQTVTAINALAGSNVALKLKCGSVWRTTTQIDIKGGSISAYGSGDAPYISGFTTTIASGGSAWTVATGDRYTTTVANCGWIREQGYDWAKVYKRAASTAEVEATPNSWYITGTTLSINAGTGINPNNVAWEISPTGGANYYGIITDETGGRIDGLVIAGQACEDDTGASYAVNVLVRGEEVACTTNCEMYYHPVHNWGHAVSGGSTGGRSLLMDCTLGWCASSGVGGITNHVCYQDDGEGENICIGVKVPFGQLPENVTRDYGKGRAFYGHTDGGGAELGAVHIIDCHIPAGSDYSPADMGYFNNVPTATSLSDVRFVFHRCTTAANRGVAPVICTRGNAWTCCIFKSQLLNVYDSISAVYVFNNMEGFFIASYYEFDIQGSAAARVAMTNPTANTNILPKFANSHIHLVGRNGATDIEFFNHDWYGTFSFNGQNDPTCYNTLWTAENMGAGKAFPSIGNPDPTTTADNNAVFGIHSNAYRDSYTNWLNTTVLTAMPRIDQTRAALLTIGDTTVPIVPEVDLYGRPLLTPGESIGPYGQVDLVAFLATSSSSSGNAFYSSIYG